MTVLSSLISLSTDPDQTQGRALLRAIETSAAVRRRHHFFVWLTSYVSALLPHQIAICGAWSRTQKGLHLEQFNAIVLPDEALAALLDRDSPLMDAVVSEWIKQGAQPLALNLSSLEGNGAQPLADRLLAHGISQLLVHGVARPQRRNEIETLFVLATPNETLTLDHLRSMELLTPYLQATYLRVLDIELEMKLERRPTALPKALDSERVLTARELQVLALIRDGMSNQLVGEELNISALTVKNHVQKLLRKLGASNRAQAVARATALRLLAGTDSELAAAALPKRKLAAASTRTL